MIKYDFIINKEHKSVKRQKNIMYQLKDKKNEQLPLFLTQLTQREISEIQNRNLELERTEDEVDKLYRDIIGKFDELKNDIDIFRSYTEQKCKKCNETWNISKKAKICPFCGADINAGLCIEKEDSSEDRGVKKYIENSDTNMSIDKDVLVKYTGGKEFVVIPKTVRKIAKFAFYATDVDKIFIPETVKVIEQGAFKNCTCLRYVVGGEGIEEIGKDVFEGCDRLELSADMMYRMAKCCEYNDVRESIKYYKGAAKKGHAKAKIKCSTNGWSLD